MSKPHLIPLGVDCPFCGNDTLIYSADWLTGGPVECINRWCASNHPSTNEPEES